MKPTKKTRKTKTKTTRKPKIKLLPEPEDITDDIMAEVKGKRYFLVVTERPGIYGDYYVNKDVTNKDVIAACAILMIKLGGQA